MSQTSDSAHLRFHVFDVHGDIDIPGASTVLFSEQTLYGLNPLRVNPDPHFGGIRKRIQGFISTINRVMHQLGPKQEAVLRNVLTDVYARYGFKADDPSTWVVDERSAHLVSDGSDGRLYIDLPYAEKEDAKKLAHIAFDRDVVIGQQKGCWWVPIAEYSGAITRWPPKTIGRMHPSIRDVLRMARHILYMAFLGTDQAAVTALEAANKTARALQQKALTLARARNKSTDLNDTVSSLQEELAKAQDKAKAAYGEYVDKLTTGFEVEKLLKYDSIDVLKSVVDRLENLDAIGIFKAAPPPFDPNAKVWRYNISALSIPEQKLFVPFRLEELFASSVQRGETHHIQDVLIVDEAHRYTDKDPDNIINIISKEARKFGMSLTCASQSPTHFPEDFTSSVATKIILGIDEQYWAKAATQMRVEERALRWVRPTRSRLVQMKQKGSTNSNWIWANAA
jgi:cell division protein FtsB